MFNLEKYKFACVILTDGFKGHCICDCSPAGLSVWAEATFKSAMCAKNSKPFVHGVKGAELGFQTNTTEPKETDFQVNPRHFVHTINTWPSSIYHRVRPLTNITQSTATVQS